MNGTTTTLKLIGDASGMVRAVATGAAQVKKTLGDVETDSATKLRALSQTAGRIGAAVGATLVSSALAAGYVIKQSINAADELSKSSKKIGLTTAEMSKLAYAGQLANVSIGDLESGMGRLIRAQSAALDKSSQQAQIFKALGIEVTNADGSLRKSVDVLYDFADVFQSLKGSPEAITAGIELFGRGFQSFIPLVNNGSAEIREAGNELERLGGVLETDVGLKAEQFNDNLERMQVAASGLSLQIAAELLPDMVDLSDEFVDATQAGDGVSQMARDIADVLRTLTSVTTASAKAMLTLGDAIGMVGSANLMGAMNGDFEFFSNSLEQRFTDEASSSASGPAPAGRSRGARGVLHREYQSEQRAQALRKVLEGNRAEAEAARLAARAQAENQRAMEKARAEADRLADSNQRNNDIISQMAADLAGPVESAIESHRQEVDRWREANRKGEVSAASLVRVEQILGSQLRKTTADIVEQREERAKQIGDNARLGLQDFANIQQEEINRLEAVRDGREELVHVMRAEEEIREMLKGLTEGQIKGLEKETEAIRAKARELEKLNSIMRAGDLISGILNGTTDAIVNGGNPVDAFLGGLADTLPDLLKEMDKLGQLSGTWGQNLAAIGTEILPALGNMLGTIAGGGGSGAALGSSLLGAVGMAIGGPIGAFIGSVVGGLIGGLFDGSPEVNVAGANAQLGTSTAQTRNTAFGLVKVREEGMEGISSVHVADAIEEFDFAIASMMSNAQVAAVTAALSTWRIALDGGDATIEGVLEQRFSAILNTFGGEISSFVNAFAVTLEDRAQALGDILSLQALESSGDLLSGTLTQTLVLIDEFGRAGETIAEIYNRLAQTAAAYAQVTAVAQEELLLNGLSENMQRAVEIRREELGRIDALQRQAVALGLVAAREEDLAVVREAAAAKMATLMADIQFEIADLAAELYGSPLEAINAQIEALGGAADSAGRSVADFLQSLGMSADLSPFNDRIRRGMAEDALRTAAASGDVDGFITAAEQFLQISRMLNATGSDYRADFDLVNQLGGAFGTGTGDNTATLEQLYAQQAVLQAQQEAARRLDLATQLATNVADLASLQGVSAIDLLGTLGLDPTRLAADLGLAGVDQLAAYLSAQSADADFLAQTLYDLPERIARELFDLLYVQVTGPVVAPDTGTGTTVPGGGGNLPEDPYEPYDPTPEDPYDPIDNGNIYYRGAPAPTPTDDSALLLQVAHLTTVVSSLQLVLAQIAGNTGSAASGIHDIKQQGRSMGLAAESTKTRSTRTETVR